jgi:hypothetical protein
VPISLTKGTPSPCHIVEERTAGICETKLQLDYGFMEHAAVQFGTEKQTFRRNLLLSPQHIFWKENVGFESLLATVYHFS